MPGKLWVREIKKNKIIRDTVIPCDDGDWVAALAEACRELDRQVPLVLERHTRDWEMFQLMRFLPEHFMESVPFDRMEAEYFDPDKKAARTNDIRND